jgi:sulfur-oxidizing protein SoxY
VNRRLDGRETNEMNEAPSPQPTRRTALAFVAAGLAAASAAFLPRPAAATTADVAQWLQKELPGTAQAGKVTIGAPEIAENGNTVPITIDVDSPMTAQSYVKTIVVAADGNPLPGVARFDLSPDNGQAHVEFRIRLAQTQQITAVALLSDGTLWSAAKVIKVTIGGCGG